MVVLLLISGVNFVMISKLLSLSNIYIKKFFFFFFFSVSADISEKTYLLWIAIFLLHRKLTNSSMIFWKSSKLKHWSSLSNAYPCIRVLKSSIFSSALCKNSTLWWSVSNCVKACKCWSHWGHQQQEAWETAWSFGCCKFHVPLLKLKIFLSSWRSLRAWNIA